LAMMFLRVEIAARTGGLRQDVASRRAIWGAPVHSVVKFIAGVR
jgi:hypothetical protein